MRRRRLTIVFMMLLALVFAVSCSTTQQMKTMLVSYEVVVPSMEQIDQMCTDGKLTQDQCDKAAKLYTAYKVAYQAAATALDSEDSDTFETAYAVFTSSYEDLIDFLGECGVLENE